MSKSKYGILIGRTKLNTRVYVTQDQWTDIPHFTILTEDKDLLGLKIEEACTMEPCDNIDLRERNDLQAFLGYTEVGLCNWRRVIRTWNRYHERKVLEDLHVPDYLNLYSRRDDAFFPVNDSDPVLDKVILRVELEDSCIIPHFHFVRPDKSECIICLMENRTLSYEKLTAEEKQALTEYLKKACTRKFFEGMTNYQVLLDLWVSQNSDTIPVTGEEPVPDYENMAD